MKKIFFFLFLFAFGIISEAKVCSFGCNNGSSVAAGYGWNVPNSQNCSTLPPEGSTVIEVILIVNPTGGPHTLYASHEIQNFALSDMHWCS